jgi:hypothetical protein
VVAPIRIVRVGPVAEPVPPGLKPGTGRGGAALPPQASPPQPPAPPEPLAVTTRAAHAPEAAPSAPPSPQRTTAAPIREFKSPAEVDRIAIPYPAPDMSLLSGLDWSGIPMRLRLFIDANGRCIDVQVLKTSDSARVMARVREMFLLTHFLPARRSGEDVDSYRDIELNVGGPA